MMAEANTERAQINPVARRHFVLGKLLAAFPFSIASLAITLAGFGMVFNVLPIAENFGIQISLNMLTLISIFMIVVSAIQTWEVIPAIRRAILISKKNKEAANLDSLRKREINLIRINFGISTLILLATAFARTA